MQANFPGSITALAFVMALLSYLSRAEGRTIFVTMYQRNYKSEGKKSISELSDDTVSVSFKDGILSLKGKLSSWRQKMDWISTL